MSKPRRNHPIRTAFTILGLTLAAAPLSFAQSGEAGMQQMAAQMKAMEARLEASERRAAAAESKMSDLQKQVNSQSLHGKEAAKKEGAAAPTTAEYEKANPKDFKSLTLAPQNDTPFATLDINYFYMRSAAATFTTGGTREANDGRNTAFFVPLISDNSAGRLGNELDTYLEPSFKVITNPFKDPKVTFGGVFTLSSYTAERTQADLPAGFNTLDLYAFAKGAIPFLPGAEVWAGRRGYEYQFYMNIIDRRSYVIGGDGGGINDIDLGIGKLDVAYLTASPTGGSNTSVNPLNPTGSTYGDIRTDNGNLNKQSVYARFHDIDAGPLGKFGIMGQWQHVAGGTALVSGDFQGVPGGSIYNNLNYAGGIRLPSQDGFSGALTHNFKAKAMNGDLDISNQAIFGAATGSAFDTTNTDKLRNSPYYGVSNDVLLANGNTVFTLADAHRYFFADQVNLYFKDKFELEVYAIYEHQDSGRPSVPITDAALPIPAGVVAGQTLGRTTYLNGGTASAANPLGLIAGVNARGIQDWFGVGLRPTVNITPFFAIQAEATYNYIDNEAFNAIRDAAGFKSGSGDLFKFTFCPTFHYGKQGNYPLELRFYYTFATWNDNLKGSLVGSDVRRNSNYGNLFGTQAVFNF